MVVSFHLSLNVERIAAAYPEQPLLISTESTVSEALQLMRAHRSGSVLAYGVATPGAGETLAGIFTERDALRWLAAGRSLSTSISEAMTPAPECVGAEATVGETIERMSSRGFRHLPILDATGHATGIAGVRGIVHYLVEHFPATIYTLPPDPGKSPAEREGA